MAANTADAITVTMASPPVRCRTSTPAAWTRRLDSPPAVISSPASMNSGIASRLKDCEPATICCAKKAGSMSATTTTAMVARPMAMAKGTLSAASPTKAATSTIAVTLMAAVPRRSGLSSCAGHHALDGEQADQRAGERGHAVQHLDGIGDRRRHRPARELDEAKPRPERDRRRTPQRSGRSPRSAQARPTRGSGSSARVSRTWKPSWTPSARPPKRGPGEHQHRHLLGPRGRPPEHVAHDDLDRDAGQHDRRGGDQAGPQQPGDGADDAPETLDRRSARGLRRHRLLNLPRARPP